MGPSLIVDITILFILILLSGYFAIAETSFTASSLSKIHKFKADGNHNATLLEKLLAKKEAIVSLTLFGNNTVNIFASSIATVVALDLFRNIPLLMEYAPEISSIIMTFIMLIFCEVLPKSIAIKNPEKIALSSAKTFTLLFRIFEPFIQFINKLSLKIAKLIGINTDVLYLHSGTDVIRNEIEYYHSQGSVITNDRKMLDGVLDLVEMDVETIMTHRKDVIMIDLTDTIDEILGIIKTSGHSRFPVYLEDQDSILGVLHIKDMFILLNNKKDITISDIREILMKPLFVSANTIVKLQLLEFRKKRSHIAIVVDEYGSMMGIITLEDILEEIVGSIEDEHDVHDRDIIKNVDGSYTVTGDCQIRDFNRETELDFDADDASTIAGLVIEKAGTIPEIGAEFVINDYKFTILNNDATKITSVHITKL